MAKGKKGEGVTIVIKKVEEVAGGHHGGAWKVAYADFVTAMMAFFLLMWLLNATTEQQRRGLADYFNPSNVMSSGSSGMGMPFGGTTINSVGNMARDAGSIRIEHGHRPTRLDMEDDEDELQQPPTSARRGPPGPEESQQALVARSQPGQAEGEHPRAGEAVRRDSEALRRDGEALRRDGEARDSDAARMTDTSLRLELTRREQQAMEQAADALRQAIGADPTTAALARQVSVEVTPEGLRIQLLDADGQPMFATGNAQPNDRTRALIRAVAVAAARLPNPIQITGHTDATPFRNEGRNEGRSNWELSTERANAARRLLLEAGIAEMRIRGVSGAADREPHIPEQPLAAGNRRVAITLLRQAEAPRQGAPR